jgi:hypothetical protein
MTDESPTADAREGAKRELAEAMVPAPDDLLSEVGPYAQLWFVYNLASELLIAYASRLDPDDDDADALEGTVGKALAGIGEATGMLAAACVAMGLLPAEGDS